MVKAPTQLFPGTELGGANYLLFTPEKLKQGVFGYQYLRRLSHCTCPAKHLLPSPSGSCRQRTQTTPCPQAPALPTSVSACPPTAAGNASGQGKSRTPSWSWESRCKWKYSSSDVGDGRVHPQSPTGTHVPGPGLHTDACHSLRWLEGTRHTSSHCPSGGGLEPSEPLLGPPPECWPRTWGVTFFQEHGLLPAPAASPGIKVLRLPGSVAPARSPNCSHSGALSGPSDDPNGATGAASSVTCAGHGPQVQSICWEAGGRKGRGHHRGPRHRSCIRQNRTQQGRHRAAHTAGEKAVLPESSPGRSSRKIPRLACPSISRRTGRKREESTPEGTVPSGGSTGPVRRKLSLYHTNLGP